jgi:hypothetical protein
MVYLQYECSEAADATSVSFSLRQLYHLFFSTIQYKPNTVPIHDWKPANLISRRLIVYATHVALQLFG